MSKFSELAEAIKLEVDNMTKQYESIQALDRENKIEQEKIVEQNLNIKQRIEELTDSQSKVDAKEKDLGEREKQILLREKTQMASNRLLEEKMEEFRKKSVEIINQEKKLQADLAEFNLKKKKVDENALINKNVDLKLEKIKLKEGQIDKELERLKNLSI